MKGITTGMSEYFHSYLGEISATAEKISFAAAPSFPPEAWPALAVSFLILGYTALHDAKTGRVPNRPLLFAFFLTLVAAFYGNGWILSAERFAAGFVATFTVWLIDFAYFRITKKPALGMGDAKWTGVATAIFGILATISAWIIAAWLALFWMGAKSISKGKHKSTYVHFAPFLFAGLCLAIFYWRFFRG